METENVTLNIYKLYTFQINVYKLEIKQLRSINYFLEFQLKSSQIAWKLSSFADEYFL